MKVRILITLLFCALCALCSAEGFWHIEDSRDKFGDPTGRKQLVSSLIPGSVECLYQGNMPAFTRFLFTDDGAASIQLFIRNKDMPAPENRFVKIVLTMRDTQSNDHVFTVSPGQYMQVLSKDDASKLATLLSTQKPLRMLLEVIESSGMVNEKYLFNIDGASGFESAWKSLIQRSRNM